MKENIKIALLGLIAVTLIINTFMNDNAGRTSSERSSVIAKPASSSVVSSTPEATIIPNEPIVSAGPKTFVVFDSYDHDFGDIKQDSKHEKLFSFTNTGKEPLIITNAKGSCGCTVPEYPKEPILPGETGEIKVVYSPGKQTFKQTKSVTITANTDPETTVLKVYANVIPVDQPVEEG